jgi:hypothetical protein
MKTASEISIKLKKDKNTSRFMGDSPKSMLRHQSTKASVMLEISQLPWATIKP